MNQQTRERAIRALTAGLLSSGLTSEDLRDVSRSLVRDPSVIEQVARLVGVLAENLPPSAKLKQLPRKLHERATLTAEDFIRDATSVVLSRNDCINRLKSYVQRADWNPGPKWTRQRILKSFLEVAPPSAWSAALGSLKAGPVEPDPYVEYILNHGKTKHG